MRAFGLALASALLFGASTPASKWLLGGLDPLELAGLLYLGAALGVAPLAARESFRSWHPPDRANALRLAGAVVLGGIAGPVLLLSGLRLAGAAPVSLLLNLELAATAALGAWLFREHLGRAGWLGVAGVVAAGVVVASDGGVPGAVAAALVAGACACWAVDNHLTALIDGITPARSTLAKGLAAGSTNLALGLALAPFEASAGEIAAALGVGALCYGASIALYIAAAQELGATRAQAVFASAPFLGALLAFLALGEPLTAAQVGACALLTVAIAALLRSRHAHPHAHEPLEHAHAHRHDDGHHAHAHDPPVHGRHSHPHRHEPLVHAHPHWPDLHHRHAHEPPRARLGG
jgi:drug/metabolite transporter (DMT)-like permease